jgi:hypothetical protein
VTQGGTVLVMITVAGPNVQVARVWGRQLVWLLCTSSAKI